MLGAGIQYVNQNMKGVWVSEELQSSMLLAQWIGEEILFISEVMGYVDEISVS